MGRNPDTMSGRGLLRGSGLLLRVIAIGAGLCLTAGVAGASVVPNPANDRSLVGKPIEDFRYDGATSCRDGVPKGMKGLQNWLERNVRGESWGIGRCEKWGGHSCSLHCEGRAIDWHLDAGVAKERRAAMRLIRTLLAKDRSGNEAALARRMGVQGLIFDCKSWWSGAGGLDKYSYCYKRNGHLRNDLDRTQAHRDHVHIELNWPGARKRTSFWHSRVSRR
jgi:hypothetical protein